MNWLVDESGVKIKTSTQSLPRSSPKDSCLAQVSKGFGCEQYLGFGGLPDESFDVVTLNFLLHELPLDASRRKRRQGKATDLVGRLFL